MTLRRSAISSALALFSTVLLMPTWGCLQAQNGHAFDTLAIGLQVVVNTNRNVFHDFWAPGSGVDGYLETAFYYGVIQAGVQVIPYYGGDKGILDFQSIFAYLGWGLRWGRPHRLNGYQGLSVGNTFMIFDIEEEYSKNESELGVSLNSSLRYPVNDRWTICLSGRYNTIFTEKPINLIFVSAGASYTMTTPGWMKAFLE